MRTLGKLWVHGFTVMVLVGFTMFIARLPAWALTHGLVSAGFRLGIDNAYLVAAQLAIFLVVVPPLFAWLLDKVLHYAAPQIHRALSSRRFFGR